MKAKTQFLLNKYVMSGSAKRVGNSYVLDPWSIPEDDYEVMMLELRKEYDSSLCIEGVLLTPKNQ